MGLAPPRPSGSDSRMGFRLRLVPAFVAVVLPAVVGSAQEPVDFVKQEGVQATVIDLRSVAPLDREAIYASVVKTGRLLVVDEDYETFGLSGELSAIVAEAGLFDLGPFLGIWALVLFIWFAAVLYRKSAPE